MPTTYRATLTNVGAALVADAIASGATLTWAKMALGDGNGSAVTVDPSRTSLVNEQYRAPLNDLGRDSANPNTIVGTLVVPPETGGWTIREFGIYDNASRLVAYGETPEIEKPASSAGTGINLRLRFKLVVSADANITLDPDSNEAYATIEYVKDNAVKSLSVSGRTITYTMGDGDTHTITTQDTTYSDATQSAHGLMSAVDKTALDNVPLTYLPLTGGTVTGAIVSSALYSLRKPDNSSLLTILGGANGAATAGAKLMLAGADHENTGRFCLQAGDADRYKQLIGKPDGTLTWDGTDVIYTHPSYTARTGKPKVNQTPAFGDTVTISQITSDATGHVTGATDRTITIPSTAATQSAAGLMSATDKTKLDTIDDNNLVHITGTEIVTGVKRFTQFLYPRMENVVNGTNPSANQFQSLRFVDKNNNNLGQLQMAYRTTGQRDLGLWLYDKNGTGHYPITLLCSEDGNTVQALTNVLPANTANDNQIVPTKWIRNITGITGGLEGIVAKSLSSNGYIQFASGLIIQWGKSSFNGATYKDVVFPTPFNTAVYVALAADSLSSGSSTNSAFVCSWETSSTTKTQARFVTNQTNTATFSWFAIGN